MVPSVGGTPPRTVLALGVKPARDQCREKVVARRSAETSTTLAPTPIVALHTSPIGVAASPLDQWLFGARGRPFSGARAATPRQTYRSARDRRFRNNGAGGSAQLATRRKSGSHGRRRHTNNSAFSVPSPSGTVRPGRRSCNIKRSAHQVDQEVRRQNRRHRSERARSG